MRTGSSVLAKEKACCMIKGKKKLDFHDFFSQTFIGTKKIQFLENKIFERNKRN